MTTPNGRMLHPAALVDTHRLTTALLNLRHRAPGVLGSLVSSTDGRPVAADLDGHSPGAVAALVASSLALSERLGGLVGEEPVDEVTVRTRHGYIVLTAVGRQHALAVVATPAANIARLGLMLRDHIPTLVDLLGSADEPKPSSTTVPEYRSP